MKKLLSIFLVALLVVTMSISSFAAVQSPVNEITLLPLKIKDDGTIVMADIVNKKGEKIIEVGDKDIALSNEVSEEAKKALDEAKWEKTWTVMNINILYNAGNLKADEFFDVSLLHAEDNNVLDQDGISIRLKLSIPDLTTDTNALNPVIMHYPSAEEGWQAVNPKDVVNNGDHTLTVEMESLCPIVIMNVVANDGSNGVAGFPLIYALYIIAALIVIIIILIIALIARAAKKRKAKKFAAAVENAPVEELKAEIKEEVKAETKTEASAEVKAAPVVEKKPTVTKKTVKITSKGGRMTAKDLLAANVFIFGTALAIKTLFKSDKKK